MAAAAFAALFALIVGIALLSADIEAAECGSGVGGPVIAPSAEALADIPGNYLELYEAAAHTYRLGGDGWSWLAGVGSVETDHGRLSAPGVRSGENFAGAGGPMQFLSGTWKQYGVDGDGDGRKDRYDPRDAIPGAARYLRASGAPGDWPRALFAYNHAGWYVADVTRRAAAYRGAAQAEPAPVAVAERQDDGEADSPVPSLGFPTRPSGPIIQSRADHHARPLGNWQSDNAVDVGVPSGTEVLAVADGEILRTGGSAPRRGSSVIGGYSVTLRTDSNRFFYTHLIEVRVRAGQRVSAGHVLGASGFANDVDHLHLGVERGDPDALWGGAAGRSAAPLGACATGAPAGPANVGQAVRVLEPRAFAALPAWAMAGQRPPAEVDARVLPNVLWILRTYRQRVTAARETGHESHGDGTGLDLVPEDGAWDSTERLARDIGWTDACGARGVAPACPLKPWVRFVGYNGYPSHGDPAHAGDNAHLHISWLASGAPTGGLAPPHEWVRAFPVPAGAGT
jgi:murein DD-endopeptidase MepM/ murein hydrolase activator NlpD